MTHRVANFSAGPAVLPLPVLEYTQRELLSHEGTGISLLEHSHRGESYKAVHAEAKALLTELMGIPDTHEILFMQGGATGQFALLPLNLLQDGQSGDYIITGTWGEKAIKEANITRKGRVAATTKESGYTRVAKQEDLDLDANAAYVHMTSNNTIFGTQFHSFPETNGVPLIADMSSDICSRPVDVSKFGVIYAGAQKNLGPAGVTLVIIRKDMVEAGRDDVPNIFRYKSLAAKDSLLNTGPTFPIYMVRNVLRWVKEQGGLADMQAHNEKKAGVLYDAIDGNADFFRAPVEKGSRSLMNVVFRLPTEELEKAFLAEAATQDLVGLKGHRSVGGIRASIYNAQPMANVEKLVGFMKAFAAKS